MGVGVGVGETLLSGATGGRANDPFGSKSGREIDGAIEQALASASGSLSSQALALQQLGLPSVRRADSLLGQLGDPITVESLARNPSFGAMKSAIESQFNNARQSAIATGGEGGALQGVLGGIEASRAGGLAQALGQLAQQEQQRRLQEIMANANFGTTLTNQSQRGFAGSAGAFAPLAGAQAAIAQANIAGDASNKNAKVGFQGDQFNNLSEGVGMMAGGK